MNLWYAFWDSWVTTHEEILRQASIEAARLTGRQSALEELEAQIDSRRRRDSKKERKREISL